MVSASPWSKPRLFLRCGEAPNCVIQLRSFLPEQSEPDVKKMTIQPVLMDEQRMPNHSAHYFSGKTSIVSRSIPDVVFGLLRLPCDDQVPRSFQPRDLYIAEARLGEQRAVLRLRSLARSRFANGEHV